ncbi:MAG: type II secretion system inner membrane protein GspF [Abyssibacter sp.]|uniref:type II secretion system inner membrane protein GspF n=1 Tax=Abyssibacter sp. TaxID=2320200 RepID=UPI002ECAAC61|nr:type II secretion system inner membrane protein GspF [Pseudomonadota bacterium]
MAAFEYKAIDRRGRQQKGLMEADTARQVRQQLRDNGLMPTDVREVAEASGSQGLRSARGFSSSELALFTRQLATLLRSGLPLEEALSAVAEQTESKKVKRTTLGVRASVLEGHTLAHALAAFPGAFSTLYLATVEAGEHSGHLDLILERLADYVESRQQMQQKIVLASFYPAILSLVAVLVVVLLLTFVVPQVVDVFSSIDQELPALTRGMIATSDFLRAQWWLLLGGIAAIALGWSLLKRRESFRFRVDAARLRLPLIGRLARGLNTARFTRTLSILTGSGVPMLDALKICEQVVSNLPMREAITHATRRVREGESISKSLAASGLFPPIAVHLIASGEQSGKLDEMLDRAAVHQEREVETLVAGLMGVFEPLLILTMGGFVLMIVLAILLPIFELNSLVQ